MKVKGLVNNVLGEFEIECPPEAQEPKDELLTFTRSELELFIENYITEFKKGEDRSESLFMTHPFFPLFKAHQTKA